MNRILEVNIGTIILGLIKSIIIQGLHAAHPYIHFPINSVNTVVKPELRLNVDDVVLSGVSNLLDLWIPVVSVAGL